MEKLEGAEKASSPHKRGADNVAQNGARCKPEQALEICYTYGTDKIGIRVLCIQFLALSPSPPVQLIFLKVIGCSSLRGGGGELVTNKNLDLWLQLVCTKLKLKHAI